MQVGKKRNGTGHIEKKILLHICELEVSDSRYSDWSGLVRIRFLESELGLRLGLGVRVYGYLVIS
jgi:hypothetical protein